MAARLEPTRRRRTPTSRTRASCARAGSRPDTTYHAFVVPAFESGRLAGLGLDPTAAPPRPPPRGRATAQDKNDFPVYYRWRFRTGALGDFEYLVRLLQPRPVDRRVGVRDMDVQQPGANLPGIDDPALHGVLQLGGALRVPRASLIADERAEVHAQEHWAQPCRIRSSAGWPRSSIWPTTTRTRAAAQANAQADVQRLSRGDPDPLITPPLYGRWHALTPRLAQGRATAARVPNADNWVHELNLDPRFRVPAGFGTRVVQDRQEDLMAAAWEQIGDVLEANARMRRLQLAQQVAFVWHRAHLAPVAAARIRSRARADRAGARARDAGAVTMRHAGRGQRRAAGARRAQRCGASPGRVAGWCARCRSTTRARAADDLIARVNRGEVQHRAAEGVAARRRHRRRCRRRRAPEAAAASG